MNIVFFSILVLAIKNCDPIKCVRPCNMFKIYKLSVSTRLCSVRKYPLNFSAMGISCCVSQTMNVSFVFSPKNRKWWVSAIIIVSHLIPSEEHLEIINLPKMLI